MAKYSVDLPIAGYVTVKVEAENEKEAIQKAFEVEWNFDDVQELDAYEKLVEGNVCHTYHTRAEATKIDDDDEE